MSGLETIAVIILAVLVAPFFIVGRFGMDFWLRGMSSFLPGWFERFMLGQHKH